MLTSLARMSIRARNVWIPLQEHLEAPLVILHDRRCEFERHARLDAPLDLRRLFVCPAVYVRDIH